MHSVFSGLTISRNQHRKLVEWRMTRFLFRSTSSPFFLMATIHSHLDNTCEDKEVTSAIKTAIYVNYLLVGADTFHEGRRIYEPSKAIMKNGCMNLRMWKTYDRQQQNIFDNQEEHREKQLRSWECIGV